MSDEIHVLDLLPAYALGSLEADEVSRVEEHLSGCLICRNESNAFQATADQLSLAAPIAAPSPDLKERLRQRVQKLDGSRAGRGNVGSHAAAGIEHDSDMELRGRVGLVPADEILQRLRLAVLEELEVLGGEVGQKCAPLVRHRDAEAHQVSLRPEHDLGAVGLNAWTAFLEGASK